MSNELNVWAGKVRFQLLNIGFRACSSHHHPQWARALLLGLLKSAQHLRYALYFRQGTDVAEGEGAIWLRPDFAW